MNWWTHLVIYFHFQKAFGKIPNVWEIRSVVKLLLSSNSLVNIAYYVNIPPCPSLSTTWQYASCQLNLIWLVSCAEKSVFKLFNYVTPIAHLSVLLFCSPSGLLRLGWYKDSNCHAEIVMRSRTLNLPDGATIIHISNGFTKYKIAQHNWSRAYQYW